jgi:outer membrane protein, multidrug efflux system
MRRRAAGLLVLATVGCAVGPNYKRPPLVIPEQFYGQSGAPEAESTLANARWWDGFGDAVLRSLIDEALRNGYDVRIAAMRVEEARARYGIAGAAFYPQLEYQAGLTAGHTSKFAEPSDVTGTVGNVSVGLSWELDVWGRIRRLNEAARAEYLATEEARRGVLLSLSSDVASAYFELRELDEELEVARRNSAAFMDVYDLFTRRLQGGAASALETARAEAALANVRAQVPLLERRIVGKENQLALLLGRNPGPIERGMPLAAQPSPLTVPPGLPSTLIERRPDLREAEQLLVAANANVGVAEAAFFPTFSLTGLLGGLSPQLSELFGEGKTWNVNGGLLGPLFQGGQLRKQKRAALAVREQARLGYERTVANAFGETSTALISVEKLAQAEAEQARAVAANREAVRLANLRYTSGFSAYFEVLDAMGQLFVSENSLVQVRRDRLVATAQLYKALGGGWNDPAGAVPSPR